MERGGHGRKTKGKQTEIKQHNGMPTEKYINNYSKFKWCSNIKRQRLFEWVLTKRI